MQIAGTAVVTESSPETQHVLFVGAGQVGEGGKGRQEALEIGDDGRDLRLLKHDLADPDAIGVAISTPGKVPLMCVEPGEEVASDGAAYSFGCGQDPPRPPSPVLEERGLGDMRFSGVSFARKTPSSCPSPPCTGARGAG